MLLENTCYVMFDAGGTLIGTNTDSEFWYEQFFVDACAEQGCIVSVSQVHEVLRRAARSRQFDNRCSTDVQTRAFWVHMYTTAFADLLGARGVTHTPAVIEHLANDYIDRFEDGEFIKVFPDTLETLAELKKRNIPMGVVSNFGTYLNHFFDKLELSPYFDFIMASAGVGCEKPNPEIFQKAVTKSGVEDCSRILFVGDHPDEDYAPALQAGMKAVLIDRHNRHANASEIVRVNKLSDILNS